MTRYDFLEKEIKPLLPTGFRAKHLKYGGYTQTTPDKLIGDIEGRIETLQDEIDRYLKAVNKLRRIDKW